MIQASRIFYFSDFVVKYIYENSKGKQQKTKVVFLDES